MLSAQVWKITNIRFRKVKIYFMTSPMSTLAVRWYEYEGQRQQWRGLWTSLANYLPLDEALNFFEESPETLWRSGQYDLTWACGGDVACTPHLFSPICVPVFKDAQTPEGHYCSPIIQRRETLGHPKSDLRVGLNMRASVSGHFALARWWQEQGYAPPAQVHLTGGHELSVQALIGGDIDLAAIDSQGWPLLLRAYPELTKVMEVVGHTAILRAPPICLPAGAEDKTQDFRDGFAQADRDLRAAKLSDQGLGLIGFRLVEKTAYEQMRPSLLDQIVNGPLLIPAD